MKLGAYFSYDSVLYLWNVLRWVDYNEIEPSSARHNSAWRSNPFILRQTV